MLVIDPDECIDCNACVPACPAEAIFLLEDVPEGQSEFIEINARLAKIWPSITVEKEALPGADAAKKLPGKRADLSELPGR